MNQPYLYNLLSRFITRKHMNKVRVTAPVTTYANDKPER